MGRPAEGAMGEAIRILLVEDSEDDAFLIQREIVRGGKMEAEFRRVDSREAMEQALSDGPWDVIVSDFSLPGFSGLHALHLVRERGLDVPFIIVSGAIGEETAVELMRTGARDYIMKDALARLGPAIERELREAEVRRKKREADERIRTSLREKEALLTELHHRVKNNMQLISSLLRLQAPYVRDEFDRGLFKKSIARIRAMSLVHERLYESDDFSAIDIPGYVRALAEDLYYSIGVSPERVALGVEVSGISLSMSNATPFGLILSELISNALQHAFPAGRDGRLSITLGVDPAGRGSVLVVADDGVGIEGFTELQNMQSLGFRLVLSLAGQLRGEVSCRTSASGTSVSIRFPDLSGASDY